MKHKARNWNRKLFRRWKGSFFRLTFKSLPLVLSLGVLCFIFFGVRQMVYADPYFRVERITVFPSGILSYSEYQFLEDQAHGRSIAEIDLKQISRSLERNPKVKRAEVTRNIPK